MSIFQQIQHNGLHRLQKSAKLLLNKTCQTKILILISTVKSIFHPRHLCIFPTSSPADVKDNTYYPAYCWPDGNSRSKPEKESCLELLPQYHQTLPSKTFFPEYNFFHSIANGYIANSHCFYLHKTKMQMAK